MKKTLTLLSLALLLVAWINPTRFTLQPESRLWIEGTSSLHDWTCAVGQFGGAIETAEAAAQVAAVQVTVAVQQIDCDNGTMNKKLLDALKSKEHPFIKFELTQAEVTRPGSPFALNATGRLQLAGASKAITMKVEGKDLGLGRVRYTGKAALKMSDFGIDPPTALLGTLKTGDAVTVHYEVIAAR